MLVRKNLASVLFFFISISWSVCSQDIFWQLKSYGKDQGLVQNTITAIAEDNNGMIWVGTQSGVHRFDGYEFEVFNRNRGKSGAGLKSDYIQSLETDLAGRLWVGTSRGLHLFQSDTFVPYGHDVYSSAIHALATDKKGVLWLATNDGLYRIAEDDNTLTPQWGTGTTITSIIAVKGGLYLIVDGKKIIRYQPSTSTSEIIYNAAENQKIFTMAVIGNTIFVGTSHGLFRLAQEQVNQVAALEITSVVALQADVKDRLWVSTGSKLFQLSELTLSKPNLKSISSTHDTKQVISLFVDSNRIIWLGTQNSGLLLHVLHSKWIESITVGPNESEALATLGESVTALDQSEEGQLWQGSNQGIAQLNLLTERRKNYLLGEQHDGIRSQVSVIKVDGEGNVWAGYRNGPLTKFDKNSGTFRSQTPDLKVFITDIIGIANNKLLFTTRDNGVFLFDTETKTTDPLVDKTKADVNWPTNRFQSSLRWQQDKVWLGSFDSGLMLFNLKSGQVEKHFHEGSEHAPLNDNLVISLLNDKERGLYIGSTSGLAYLDTTNDQFTFFTDVDLLVNQTVYGIERDSSEQLWIATNTGIIRFDPSSRQARLFNSEDGLPNNEFNSNALIYSNNTIYAGGVKGLSKLNTAQVPEPIEQPQVYLTDFYLAGKVVVINDETSPIKQPLNQVSEIELDYLDNGFSIGFLAINYQAPMKIQYQYRLQPFDREWIEVDHRRRLATYTNLDPGSYTFSVKSSLDGIHWGSEKTISLVITAAPWRSPLAYTIYLLVIIIVLFTILYLLHKKREFERRAYEQVREKEQELSLALWGSGDEFWNYNVNENKLYRRNTLTTENYFEVQSGEEFIAAVHPDDVDVVMATLNACVVHNENTFELTYRIRDIEGNWAWVLGKGQVSKRETETGRPLLISGAIKNIDKLKKAQEALVSANDQLEEKVKERTAELVEANKEVTYALERLESTQQKLVESEKMASLGNMVAGIAHEINTPLGVAITSLSHSESVIAAMLTSMQDKTLTAAKFSQLSNDLQAGVELAQRNLRKAGELVNSFKQVSVDQSSEQSRLFDLRQLLEDTVNTLKPKLNNTDIEVKIEVENDIRMTSYPGAISQVLVNFISNSITHGFKSDSSGLIEISAFLNGESSVLLIYKDTGQGIEEENRGKVFEPFYTTNRNQGNTGLGMHISYNLITQKLNGEILLNSRAGEGVEFYIHLPLSVNDNKIVLPNK